MLERTAGLSIQCSATRCLQIDVQHFSRLVYRISFIHLSVYTQGKQVVLL